jgi:hypothetical protein
MTKYRVIFIRKTDFEQIKKLPVFVTALQLARLVNSLRSCFRIYVRINDWGRLTDTKDRIEELYIWASVLYEGAKELFRREEELRHTKVWRESRGRLGILKGEMKKGKPYWVMLHDIRNDVMFHFYPTALENSIDEYVAGEEVNFAVGRTSQIKDTVYILGDDILLRHIFDRKGINGNTIGEKIDGLTEYLRIRTDTLISVIDPLLIELLKPLGANLKRKVLE